MRIDLQKARDWADLVLKAVSVVAIIAGGSWAYYQFRVTETNASNIQLTISTEVVKYSDENRLLLIHIKPKNIGKVLVTPGKDGLVLTVRKLPDDYKPGAVDLAKLSEVHKVDVLKKYPEGYELEPGVEYDEVDALIVPKGTVYAVDAVMDLGDSSEVDQMHVVQVE